MSKLPEYSCISCCRLIPSDNLIDTSEFYSDEKYHKIRNSEPWKILLKKYNIYKDKVNTNIENEIFSNIVETNTMHTKSLDSEFSNSVNQENKENRNGTTTSYFICKYCYLKIKDNYVPSMSILNNLEVVEMPKELSSLNMYETILIQRAKVFQTVLRKETVMNKNLPNHVKIPKVIGRSFHLPLPIQETLNKLCSETDPINKNHELHILVRSVPGKAKVVWESLVDLEKVWLALQWLKNNNPLYDKIELPEYEDRSKLLDGLDDLEHIDNAEKEVMEDENENCSETEIDENLQINCEDVKKQALLTQKLENDVFYEHLTIYPLYGKRENQSCSKLYQMLPVQNQPLNFRAKDLDLKCFPQLFPEGKDGQHEFRNTRLRDSDFVKSRLMNKDSRFRSNIQYIFYLLFDDTIRKLNAGIFHKLNIVNSKLKYTKSNYLEQLSKDQLETNLNTIFSRLPNTEAFFKKAKNELNCMIQNYGPATFFVTFSPSEWMWSELGEYLRRHCDPKNRSKSISELIVIDPILTATFFEQKFKATLAFILSPSNPIGEVSHYFFRREY